MQIDKHIRGGTSKTATTTTLNMIQINDLVPLRELTSINPTTPPLTEHIQYATND